MQFIQKNPFEGGGYPGIQTCDFEKIPSNLAVWPDDLDTSDFYAYNGFVTLTIEQADGVDTVTGYKPSAEAWEAWKASLPEPTDPEPTQLDRVEAQVVYTAMMTDTLLEV